MTITRGQRLRLSLTARCPLRCSFCHGDGNTHPSNHARDGDVPLRDVVAVVAMAAGEGFSTVRFTGGEPGSYGSFHELIEILPQLRIVHPGVKKWGLTTAGVPFLDEDKLNILASSALTDVAVSVDSVEEGERSRPSSPGGVSGLSVFDRVVLPLARVFSGSVKINVVFDGNAERTKNVIRRARRLGLPVTVLEVNGLMGKVYDLREAFAQLRTDVAREFCLADEYCEPLNEHYLCDRNGRQQVKFYPDHCGAYRECRICGDLEVRVIPVDGVLGIIPCFEQDQGHTVSLFVDGEPSIDRFREGVRHVGVGPEWHRRQKES